MKSRFDRKSDNYIVEQDIKQWVNNNHSDFLSKYICSQNKVIYYNTQWDNAKVNHTIDESHILAFSLKDVFQNMDGWESYFDKFYYLANGLATGGFKSAFEETYISIIMKQLSSYDKNINLVIPVGEGQRSYYDCLYNVTFEMFVEQWFRQLLNRANESRKSLQPTIDKTKPLAIKHNHIKYTSFKYNVERLFAHESTKIFQDMYKKFNVDKVSYEQDLIIYKLL